MRFTGKTVYVTEACTAQGEALSVRFAKEGANLVLGKGTEELLKTIENLGVKAMIVDPDIVTPEGCEKLVEEVNGRFGRIDVLVHNNNHAVKCSVATVSHDLFIEQVNENAKSAYLLTVAVGNDMAKYGNGKIVYVSSIHCDKPTGSTPMYSVAKGCINMLCKEAALFYGRKGVQCNIVEAGAIEGDAEIFESTFSNLYVMDLMDKKVPRKKAGTQEEIAGVAAFLASDDAAFVNGANIRADGGFMLHYGFRD